MSGWLRRRTGRTPGPGAAVRPRSALRGAPVAADALDAHAGRAQRQSHPVTLLASPQATDHQLGRDHFMETERRSVRLPGDRLTSQVLVQAQPGRQAAIGNLTNPGTVAHPSTLGCPPRLSPATRPSATRRGAAKSRGRLCVRRTTRAPRGLRLGCHRVDAARSVRPQAHIQAGGCLRVDDRGCTTEGSSPGFPDSNGGG